MDSEDDMHDANDMESVDDDFYSDGDGYGGGDAMDSDGDVADYDFMGNESDNSDDQAVSRTQVVITSMCHKGASLELELIFSDSKHFDVIQKNYTVLKEEDIRQRQEDDMTTISTLLSIPREAACILLRRYNWSVNKVHEEWFADEERVRKSAGLLEKPVVPLSRVKEVVCGICFENYPPDGIISVGCGHPFCATCWKAYITTSINDGPGCLMLQCPDPSCDAAIGQDMIDTLASGEDKDKKIKARPCIELNLKGLMCFSPETKWCPAPGCDSAIEYDLGSGSYDVTCCCSFSFCWNCTEEAHRPVDCDTVSKWILKNSAESENMNWLCLGAWLDHGERTGGFYACNRYESAKQEGVKRYGVRGVTVMSYVTLFAASFRFSFCSRGKKLWQICIKCKLFMIAVGQCVLQLYSLVYVVIYFMPGCDFAPPTIHRLKNDIKKEKLEKLSEIQCQPESQLKFIIESWQQVVECRRVLKWTYAYGYYLPEHEHAKRQFFEYVQGEAEAGLERLHRCAEKELQTYLYATRASKDFNDFRTKLAGLTSVTRNYFENLVRALENGLADVDSQGACSKAPSSKNITGSSKGKGGGRGKNSTRT
ncbi:hypothetical protein RND71_006385 [Anisodus tanguticus]|uniref:RBR-type E3 ubiquitin transferase n=1 Tax=Anisodus tanguticus TaxID=243964 RepID=A0AAE1SU54_9SOLA|nr:hypothetical protein RND71_006385 [Anisodus tanguticus]